MCRRESTYRWRQAAVLASVISASRHDAGLRAASQDAIGTPYSRLFEQVLPRAVDRGTLRPDLDVAILAQVWPAFAYHKVAAEGLLVDDGDVVRVVDQVLLPALAPPP